MRQIFTAILLLLAIAATAQTFTVEVNDTTLYGHPDDDDFYGDIDLNNLQSLPVQMAWEVVDDQLPVTWEVSFCDPSNCYPIGITSHDFTLPVGGSNNIFNVHFYPNGMAGSGTVQVRVYNRITPTEEQFLFFTGKAQWAASVTPFDGSGYRAWPNPFNSVFQLETDLNRFQEVQVFNLMGKMVYSSTLIKNHLTIDGNHLDRGIYFLKLIGKDSTVTRRIVKR
jgi:hypothetical protein